MGPKDRGLYGATVEAYKLFFFLGSALRSDETAGAALGVIEGTFMPELRSGMHDAREDARGNATGAGNIPEIAIAAVCTLGILALAIYLTQVFAGSWWGVALFVAVIVGLSYPEAVLKRCSAHAVTTVFAVVCGVGIGAIFYMIAARTLHAWAVGVAAGFFIFAAATLVGLWAVRFATVQIRKIAGDHRASGKVSIASLAYQLATAILLAILIGPVM